MRDEKLNGSWAADGPFDFAAYLFNFIATNNREAIVGIFGSLKEQLALLILPVVVSEGWAAVPEHLKAEVCVLLGVCETELRAKALTTETGIDDAAIDAVYTQARRWAGEQGFPNIMGQLDQFVQVGK